MIGGGEHVGQPPEIGHRRATGLIVPDREDHRLAVDMDLLQGSGKQRVTHTVEIDGAVDHSGVDRPVLLAVFATMACQNSTMAFAKA